MVGVRAMWMKCESAAAAAAACLCLQRRRIAAERSNDCVLRRGQRANLKDQTAGIKADLAVKRTENRGLLLLPKEQRDGSCGLLYKCGQLLQPNDQTAKKKE